MPIQAVVTGIDLAILKPFGKRRIGPIKGLGKWLVPSQLVSLFSPEG